MKLTRCREGRHVFVISCFVWSKDPASAQNPHLSGGGDPERRRERHVPGQSPPACAAAENSVSPRTSAPVRTLAKISPVPSSGCAIMSTCTVPCGWSWVKAHGTGFSRRQRDSRENDRAPAVQAQLSDQLLQTSFLLRELIVGAAQQKGGFCQVGGDDVCQLRQVGHAAAQGRGV